MLLGYIRENRGKSLLIAMSVLIWILILVLFKTYGYEDTWHLWKVPTWKIAFLDFRLIPGSADSFRKGMAVATRSRVWQQPRDQVAAERVAKVPLGRQATAWDVANTALFLASEESSFITGVNLLVDGGRILNRI